MSTQFGGIHNKMSVRAALREIGVSEPDLVLLDRYISKHPCPFNIKSIVRCRTEHGECIYHDHSFSKPFKMVLRVLVGLVGYGTIDRGHRNAIFYDYEHPVRKEDSDLAVLDKFWDLLEKLFNNSILSRDVYRELNKTAADPKEWRLKSNIIEFNIPLIITRSKSHLSIDAAELEVQRCNSQKIEKQREERRIERLRQRIREWTIQCEIQMEEFNKGTTDGQWAGGFDGHWHGVEDGKAHRKTDPMATYLENQPEGPYAYMDGYRNAYLKAFKKSFNAAYSTFKPLPLKRKLDFDSE